MQATGPLFDAMSFVRDHTRPGEWIYSNIISSDNYFSFFTSGRFSLLEGPSIYQQFTPIRQAAQRIRTFTAFAESTDTASLAPYGARYVVLYTNSDCQRAYGCYGEDVFSTNLALFASSPAFRRVYENRDFIIYRLTGRPDSPTAAVIARDIPRCETTIGSGEWRTRACTQLLSLVGNVDSSVLYFRGLADLAAKQYKPAIYDLNRFLAREPQNADAYYRRALAYAATGDLSAASSDLDLAEQYATYLAPIKLAEAERLKISRITRGR
jgi:hypothetical protein